LGLWEKLNNPDFKLVEFDQFKNEAGFNHFVLSPKKWRAENPDKKGNMRDYSNVSQLVCLTNLENLNAVLINEGLKQAERLSRFLLDKGKISTIEAKLKLIQYEEFLCLCR
jgi:hypothetical protein